jgi:hypothetical protein
MKQADIIKKLSEKLPEEAIQRTKGSETRKGYDTDGYSYQYCVDRFNDVLGINWSYEWEIIYHEKGQFKNGTTYHDIAVKVIINIVRHDENPQPHYMSRSCVGGHISKIYSDALKGAITNAFKKTAAFFGVGRDAFAGTIDDDNKPYPDLIDNKTKENKTIEDQIKKEFNGEQLSLTNKPIDPMEQNNEQQMRDLLKDLSETNKNWFKQNKFSLKQVYDFCSKYAFNGKLIEDACQKIDTVEKNYQEEKR